jgi:hypothetical protein
MGLGVWEPLVFVRLRRGIFVARRALLLNLSESVTFGAGAVGVHKHQNIANNLIPIVSAHYSAILKNLDLFRDELTWKGVHFKPLRIAEWRTKRGPLQPGFLGAEEPYLQVEQL